jgi:hypothetical protein
MWSGQERFAAIGASKHPTYGTPRTSLQQLLGEPRSACSKVYLRCSLAYYDLVADALEQMKFDIARR